MHLITRVVIFLSAIALTFADLIISTPPPIPTSISVTYDSTPTRFPVHHSYAHHSLTTTLSTHAKPTYSHSQYDAEHTQLLYKTHSVLEHSFTRPTGSHHPTVYHKPTASPGVYVRDETEADKRCCHIQCFSHFCECIGSCDGTTAKPLIDYVDETSLASRSETDAVSSLTTYLGTAAESTLLYRDDNKPDYRCIHISCTGIGHCWCLQWGSNSDVEPVVTNADDTSLTTRNEAGTVIDLADPEEAMANSRCKWACFGTVCECLPNAGGKSVVFHKTLAVLAMLGAVIAAADLI